MNPDHITLLKMALEYLGDRPESYARYAKRIKSQLALLQSCGRPITINDWTRMAKLLSEEAISRDIGAERIAKTIYPLVDGLGQHARTLAYIPAPFACQQLLRLTRINASTQIRQLLTQVIIQLQKLVTSNGLKT
ncbi:hypothetical protein LX73_1240 [Fodinibius salinus]|uniref:Uncharacterized protein n=1 Tax=Fodinibius salinus TaxID=860790 RepID=A0A5D3YI56_9BACT|nr:hypothetical protein [Fodinibius salinus]TYP93534.1 hypothetical protein LX73_1240 [Fodinibius salinus]